MFVLLGVGAVVVLAIVAVFVGSRYLQKSGSAGSEAGPRPTSTSTHAAPPVKPEVLETYLTKEGFSCYQTFGEPNVLRSCYRTEPGGARLTVRVQAGPAGATSALAIEGTNLVPGGAPARGDASAGFQDLLPQLAERLLGRADQLPSTDPGAASTRQLSWGTWEQQPRPGGAYAAMTVGEVPDQAVTVTTPSLSRSGDALTKAGFRCDGSRCTQGNVLDSYAIAVDDSGDELKARAQNGAKRVTVAAVRTAYEQVLTAHLASVEKPVEAAQEWIRQNSAPRNGFAEADFEGYHVAVVGGQSGGSSSGQLTISVAEPLD